jgi:hypothetical protein
MTPKTKAKAERKTEYNDKGQVVRYEVELWQYANAMRLATEITYKEFDTKDDAQSYANKHIKTGLVSKIVVTLLTYDKPLESWAFSSSKGRYSILPTRKEVYKQVIDELKANTNER